MTKRISFLATVSLCASLALVAVPLLATPAYADDSQSITDLAPLDTATPTPDVVATPTPTPDATPEALPTTGTSPYLLIVLAVLLLVSAGAYALMPRPRD